MTLNMGKANNVIAEPSATGTLGSEMILGRLVLFNPRFGGAQARRDLEDYKNEKHIKK